jgi:hypothetical protein
MQDRQALEQRAAALIHLVYRLLSDRANRVVVVAAAVVREPTTDWADARLVIR